MSYLDIVSAQLRIDEDVRNRPYKDTTGHLTIGCGRNLDDVGVNDDEIALMLANDVEEADRTARKLVPNFDALSDIRKAVVVNMAFNMGYETLSGFVSTLAAINSGRWNDAASGMLASRWAKQVGIRAVRLARQMRSDKL